MQVVSVAATTPIADMLMLSPAVKAATTLSVSVTSAFESMLSSLLESVHRSLVLRVPDITVLPWTSNPFFTMNSFAITSFSITVIFSSTEAELAPI